MQQKNDCRLERSIEGNRLIEPETELDSSGMMILDDCIGFPICPYADECQACHNPNIFANDIGAFPDYTEKVDGKRYQRFIVLHSQSKDLVILTDGLALYWRKESKLNDEPLVRIDTIDDLLLLCGFRRKRFR